MKKSVLLVIVVLIVARVFFGAGASVAESKTNVINERAALLNSI